MLGPGAMHEMIRLLRVFLARTHELAPGASTFRLAGLAWLSGAAPFVLAAMFAGVVVVLVQTRFLLSGKALKVDFKRVSPGAGLKRLLGPESLVEAVKSVAKIVVIGIVLWRVMLADLPMLMLAPFGDPNQLLTRAAGPVLHVLLVVLAAQAADRGAGLRLGHAAPRARAAHEPPRHPGRAEGDRGRSAGEGAASGRSAPSVPAGA